MFPETLETYNEHFKRIGRQLPQKMRARLDRPVTSYIWRHTFASQGARHDLPIETIAFQGGWTNYDTIKAFYQAVDVAKLKHGLQGKRLDVEPWHEWLEDSSRKSFSPDTTP